MTAPDSRFMIPEEDRRLFASLDRVRLQIKVLEDMVFQCRETERGLAGQVYSKYGIPVKAQIDFRDWMVFGIGGTELPASPAEGTAAQPREGGA